MPTERFYRLPKEKADAIRMAAIREFKRVPPEEVSINRIIRDADISRGSFYTYFEDKKELLKWLIADGVKETQRFYVKTIQTNGGDIWDLFDKALDVQLDICETDRFVEIFVNIIKSGMLAEVFRLDKEGDQDVEATQDRLAGWIYQKCDKTKCPLEEKEFHELMEMHMLALMVSMKQYFKDGQSREQIRSSYFRRVDMLHYGVCSGINRRDREERTE